MSISGKEISNLSVSEVQNLDVGKDKSDVFEKKLKQGKESAQGKPNNEAAEFQSTENRAKGNQGDKDSDSVTKSRGRPKLPEGESKVRISMMLDPSTLNYLKSLGPGYQTLANAVLGESLPGKRLEQFTVDLAQEIKAAKGN